MSKKKRIVIANWKSHPESLVKARKIFSGIKHGVSRIRRTRVVICPPALFLTELMNSYGGSGLVFGAQDVSVKEKGSHTGEVTATMLARSGVHYVIVGHSERRALGETDEVVAAKLKVSLKAGLTTVLCVGELERDSEARHLRFLEREIKHSLRGVSRNIIKRLIVAYEPIWAIGRRARDAMNAEELHRMTIFLRKTLSKIYGRKIALPIPIIYGGSVEPSNAETLLSVGMVGGFLVGHASLSPSDFTEIVKIVDKS